MAKKEGPCRHCGVTSTPLWRNGPQDKPVLCNACGSRWRIKGTLVNYTPAHRREDTDASEARPDKLKLKGQKQPKKRPNRSIVKDEPCSDQNFWKMGNADTSNRSGSGSAVSYSESCAPYGSVDAREMAGSAQSHAWESVVPSRKRSCVSRPKPSPVEELVEDLNYIMHEEQLYHLSAGSTEEDLLYHTETTAGSFEIGYGSVLLRHPNSESEANSVPADSKSYVTSESYSGSASFIAHSEIKRASDSNAASEKLKWLPMQAHDSARRDELHYSNQHILESADLALVSVALEDNYSKEVGGRGNAGGAFRGLTKPSMRSPKRPHESQQQSFTEVRGGTMRMASSRSRAMASSCQLRRSAFLPKSGNTTRAAAASLNLFMLAPDKLSSMMSPSDKDSDQDSLLLEIPRNARHLEAELLLCCPPPSQLSSVTVTAASPPSNHSPGSVTDQLRNKHQW